MTGLVQKTSQQVVVAQENRGLAARGLSTLSNIGKPKIDAEALYKQGLIFYEAKNYVKAFECFLAAAEYGHANAQYNLGVMYKNGEGVERDYVQAVAWYRKAAEQGYAKAQCNLGIMYAIGCGVEQDDVQAVYWFHKAAEQGDVGAMYCLGEAYEGYFDGFEDYEQAFYWFSKGAEKGCSDAQCSLGLMYASGRVVEQDDAQAVDWYRKAAQQEVAEQGSKILCRHIWWSHLSDLTDVSFQFFQDLFSVVNSIEDNGYIKSIYVFGSRSKGDFTVNSDLDLAIELNHPPHLRLMEFPVFDSCDALMHTLTKWLYEKLSKHSVTVDVNCYCNLDESPIIKTALAESSILIYSNEVLQN